MMRMLLFSLLISIFFLFGCKKTAEALPEFKYDKFNVSFSVSTVSDKTDASTFQQDSLKNFRYYIYNSEGYRVRSSNDSQVLNAGGKITIKENLPPGKYKYVFLASDHPITSHIADTPAEISSFIYAGIHNIYHKTVEITVGSDKIILPVVMDRLNASLEIDLLDENIPENVASIQITWFDNKYIGFDGLSFTSSRKQKNMSLISLDKNRKIQKLSTDIFNTSTPFTLYINYIDVNGKHIFGREIRDVKCFKNGRTIISGYLFNPTNPEFQTTIKSFGKEPAALSVAL